MPLGKGLLAQAQVCGQSHTCTFSIWNHLHMSSIRKVIKMRDDVGSEETVDVWEICNLHSIFL